MRNVLVTGPTGAAGEHLVEVLLRRKELENVYLLDSDHSFAASGRQVSGTHTGASGKARLAALAGAPGAPRLGVPKELWEDFGCSLDTIFHCFEDWHPGLSLRESRLANVTPVERMIELMEKNTQLHLVHLSTAFVAGAKRGLFTEFDLDCGQSFRCAYERSKFEAESLLRRSTVMPRVTVIRKSLVVSVGGGPARSPIDHLLRLLAREGTIRIAGDPRARLDLVPAIFLAQAMATLADMEGVTNRTFHVVAGSSNSRYLADIVNVFASRHGARFQVSYLPPILGPLLRAWDIVRRGQASTFPNRRHPSSTFLVQSSVFDDYLSRGFLASAGLSCPAPEDFLFGPGPFHGGRSPHGGSASQ